MAPASTYITYFFFSYFYFTLRLLYYLLRGTLSCRVSDYHQLESKKKMSQQNNCWICYHYKRATKAHIKLIGEMFVHIYWDYFPNSMLQTVKNEMGFAAHSRIHSQNYVRVRFRLPPANKSSRKEEEKIYVYTQTHTECWTVPASMADVVAPQWWKWRYSRRRCVWHIVVLCNSYFVCLGNSLTHGAKLEISDAIRSAVQ